MDAVTVWEGGAVRRTLRDVESAAEFLLDKWPEEHQGSPQHRLAVEQALEILQDEALRTWPFVATFQWAAADAGILAKDGPKPAKMLAPHIARPWKYRKPKLKRAAARL